MVDLEGMPLLDSGELPRSLEIGMKCIELSLDVWNHAAERGKR